MDAARTSQVKAYLPNGPTVTKLPEGGRAQIEQFRTMISTSACAICGASSCSTVLLIVLPEDASGKTSFTLRGVCAPLHGGSYGKRCRP